MKKIICLLLCDMMLTLAGCGGGKSGGGAAEPAENLTDAELNAQKVISSTVEAMQKAANEEGATLRYERTRGEKSTYEVTDNAVIQEVVALLANLQSGKQSSSTDAVNFDERGGGLFNATLNRFEELKTAAYFWTSESVLHAASFPDGVAHTYCDEYYCGEYIPKTISVNSRLFPK